MKKRYSKVLDIQIAVSIFYILTKFYNYLK